MTRGRFSVRAAASLAALLSMAVAAATALAPVTVAGAQTSQPGLTAKTVTVGQVDTLSGPVPGLFEGAKYGTEAYLSYINSKGGVNGRKILLNVQDDAFSGANYATETASLVDSTFALVGGFSLFDNAGVAAINAAKIPDVTESLTASRNLDQYNYAPSPLITGAARLGPLVYYKEHFGDAYKHVGTLYTDVASAEAQTVAVLDAMKSLGYNISYSRITNPFDTNFLPDVLKMKAAGVQMVYIVGESVNQVADLAQAMAQQSFVPKVFATNGVAYDSSYTTLAGSAANGTLSDMQSSLYLGQDAKSNPGVALFDKWFHKVAPGKKIDTYAVFGWEAAMLFSQALKAAGPNPTRASVIAQLNKVTSFNGGGLAATANPAEKVPPTCWLMVKVVNGNWQRTAPSPKTGYVCSPGGYYYPPGYKKFVRQT